MTEMFAAHRPAARFHLRTLGTLALTNSAGETILGLNGHHKRRLALLSALAAAGDRGRSRDQILLLFWPDATQARARHSLDQLLYALRTSVGDEVFAGVNPVRLNAEFLSSDIDAFLSAIERRDDGAAVDAYGGPFLDGFYIGDSPEFEQWVDGERMRLGARYLEALERLARRAEEAGDPSAAAGWWRRLTETDRLSNRYAATYIRALVRAGDDEAALRHAERHATVLSLELGVDAGPEISGLVADLRSKSHALGVDVAPPTRPPEMPRALRPRRRWRRYAAVACVVSACLAGIGLAVRARNDVPHDERARVHKHGSTANVAAYEFYRKGIDPSLMRSDSGVLAGLSDMDRAIALDPTFAAAYAARARLIGRLVFSDDTSATRRERRAAAERSARQAIAMDDSLAEGHAALSLALRVRFEFAPAEAEMKRAIALEPTTAVYHEWLVQQYILTNRPAEALAEARRALALEPLSASANAELAHALLANDRVDEALAALAPVRALHPPLLRASTIAAECYTRTRMWSDAIAEMQTTLRSSGPVGRAFLGYLFGRAGRSSEARQILASLVARSEYGGDAVAIATVYAGLDDRDRAFEWLDKARDDGSSLDFLPTILRELEPDPRVELVRERLSMLPRQTIARTAF